MASDEFRRILTKLGWTQKQAAHELDLALRTISRYARGEGLIPRSVEIALRSLMHSRQKK